MYKKTLTKRVCVENARCEIGTGSREGNGWWHGLKLTKRAGGREERGLGGEVKEGSIVRRIKVGKENLALVCIYRRRVSCW